MTTERYVQITEEAQRRINLWLENETFKEFTKGYSYRRFSMVIGFIGYPFKKEKWMNHNDFERFVTDDEYYNDLDFDWLFRNLWINTTEKYT